MMEYHLIKLSPDSLNFLDIKGAGNLLNWCFFVSLWMWAAYISAHNGSEDPGMKYLNLKDYVKHSGSSPPPFTLQF